MATTTKQDKVRELQRALYRAAKADSRMPAVKNVGEPCAGEPHARFEVAAGGNRNQSAIAVRNWAPPADPTRVPRVSCWLCRPRFRGFAGRGSSGALFALRLSTPLVLCVV